MTSEEQTDSKIDDQTMCPARLRRKMPVEIGGSSGSDNDRQLSTTEVELMPLARSAECDFEQFEDEHPTTTQLSHIDDIEKNGVEFRETSLPPWLEDFLFPPALPRKCQLLRLENIAVPVCYLLVGLLLGLSSSVINAYPIDLGFTEGNNFYLGVGFTRIFSLFYSGISHFGHFMECCYCTS